MRCTRFFLTTLALSTLSSIFPFTALSQAHGGGMAAGHGGAAGGHMGGMNHAAGPAHSPMAGAPAGHPTGAAAGRPGYGAHPLNQGGAYQGRNQQNDGSLGGSWTSAGFIPHGSSQDAYGRHGHGRRDGYGVGYAFIPYAAYGYGNFANDYDINYDPNDPNQQQAPAADYADNNPPATPYLPQEDGRAGSPAYDATYAASPAYAPDVTRDPSRDVVRDTARAPYRGAAATAPQTGNSASNGLGHPKVTLIFKDGRSPVKIQNYAVSQTRIFVRDNGTDRDIAISDLDVPATTAANDQAGVQFELPVKR